ncbi:MAG: helix-turn-helix transcriptional regulator [Planctomycetaceae bacterium]|nr:helix-turn-helix transcriptional regulator [Planctomycetaceae bacterium]
MKLSFRLKQILEDIGAWRHGMITEISSECQIERHRMSGLIHNKESSIAFSELAEICRYLIEKHPVPASSLPGLLFALEPDDLWSLIASRDLLRHCIGVRGTAGHYRVSWADSYLNGVLLNMLYGFSRDPMFRQPRTLEQVLVPAFTDPEDTDEHSRLPLTTIVALGQKAVTDFEKVSGNCGFICLGSCKSNIVIENVIANVFNTDAYQTQDDVETPRQRACPVFYRLRDEDPHPPSCYAGTWLSKRCRLAGQPMEEGIWYELDGDNWACCPSSETEDVAIVLYDYQSSSSRLEMVLGGFSGLATSLLAKCLPKIAKELWPPQINTQDRQLGLFLIRFRIDKQSKPTADALEVSDRIPDAEAEVIPLNDKAVQRRFARPSPTSAPENHDDE